MRGHKSSREWYHEAFRTIRRHWALASSGPIALTGEWPGSSRGSAGAPELARARALPASARGRQCRAAMLGIDQVAGSADSPQAAAVDAKRPHERGGSAVPQRSRLTRRRLSGPSHHAHRRRAAHSVVIASQTTAELAMCSICTTCRGAVEPRHDRRDTRRSARICMRAARSAAACSQSRRTSCYNAATRVSAAVWCGFGTNICAFRNDDVQRSLARTNVRAARPAE